MIEKPTWIIHFVFPTEADEEANMPYFANYHTHGLNEYGHRELCIPFAFSSAMCGTILNTMGMDIANNNKVFSSGKYDDLLSGKYDVKIIEFEDDPTLYILFPDENNLFYDDEHCDEEYALQYEYAKHISEGKDYV